MSETDSFIEEVSEEVRRDRLFALMRKYGWVAVLAVLLLVGGAGYREYVKARDRSAAQAFGDSILDALESATPPARIAALEAIEAPGAGSQAILRMLMAAETGNTGEDAAAVAQLQAVANDAEVPAIYRQIASYKAMARGAGTLSAEDRRAGLDVLTAPGQPLRLLAEEQLALLEIETGETDAAITRLQRISQDAEATAGLRRRASQLIVALGGEPVSG